MWEEEQVALWREEGTFEASVARNEDKCNSSSVGVCRNRNFVFQEGPPTANGTPGLHHVLARSVKDLVCRWKTMSGHVVVRKAGWDCHGLPVEREVEKVLGLNGRDDQTRLVGGVERFNKLCEESVWKYASEWEQFTERMGYWVDLKQRYATLDAEYMESEWWALKRLWEGGLLRKGHKVVPYSPQNGCTYSNRDVEDGYREVTDLSCFVRFPLEGTKKEWTGVGSDSMVSVVVWTSTPWTLPANVLLAVNQSMAYVCVKVVQGQDWGKAKAEGDNEEAEPKGVAQKGESKFAAWSNFKLGEVLVVAKSRLSELQDHLPADGHCRLEELDELLGSELLGRRYLPPLKDGGLDALGREEDDLLWTVVHADFVTESVGTGVVHVAPMYGEDDYELCSSLGLLDPSRRECSHVVGLDGCYHGSQSGNNNKKSTELGGNPGNLLLPPVQLRGLDVTCAETQEKVLHLLQERGLLQRAARVTHKYPYCWRNQSNRLLYYAMDSWFVAMGDPEVRSLMLKLNGLPEVRFAPESLKEGRFGSWLRGARDWSVSRKRSWGCPLPVWVCREEGGGCGRFHCVGSRAELRSLLVEPSQLMEQADLHATQVDALRLRCAECGNKNGSMRREPYVLDCWFDSGCAPFAQWHYPFAFDAKSEDAATNTATASPSLSYTGEERYNGSAERVVDFVAEGQDQCRGWFYSLLALSTTLFNRPAYKHCLSLGLVLDKDGQKMSKSRGNGVDPWEHFNEEGADALRWYLLGLCAPWSDRRFDAGSVRASNQRFFRVLYNVAKWWLLQWENTNGQEDEATQGEMAGNVDANTAGPCSSDSEDGGAHPHSGCDLGDGCCGVLDRWVLSRLATLVDVCNEHFESDHFELAVSSLEAFVNEDLSKTFLRLSRAHFVRVPSADDGRASGAPQFAAPVSARLACLRTMREVLMVLCRLVAPLAPFFVDRLYRCLMGTVTLTTDPSHSVHLASWPTPADMDRFRNLDAEMEVQLLQTFLRAGRAVHEEGSRPGRLPVARAYCASYNVDPPSALEAGEGARSAQKHPVMTKELAFFLSFELNVSEVTLLDSRDAFNALLLKAQVPSLAPDMSALGARFKDELPKVVEALREAMGHSHLPPPANVRSGPPHGKTVLDGNTNPGKEGNSSKKSKKQLKREQRAEARRSKKETMKKASGAATNVMTGPLVNAALAELQSEGALKVRGSGSETYVLHPNEVVVSCVTQPGFAVSVGSFATDAASTNFTSERDNKNHHKETSSSNAVLEYGLVLDLAVSPTMVSRYLAKEVTHFVQLMRKKLEKKRLQQGQGALEQVALHVVVQPNEASNESHTEEGSARMSVADWAVLLEDTQAKRESSLLEHVAEGVLLRECEQAVGDDTMERLSVRPFGGCPGFSVYVCCKPTE